MLRLMSIFNPNSLRATLVGIWELSVSRWFCRGLLLAHTHVIDDLRKFGWKLAQGHGGLMILVAVPREKRLAAHVKDWTVQWSRALSG